MPRPSLAFVSLALAVTLGATNQPARAQTPASAGAPKVALPQTPAGRAAAEWLDAFNNADSARLAAWNRTYAPDRSVEGQLNFRRQTGGFDVVSIEKSEPRLIEYVVKERNSPATALAVLELKDGENPVARTANVLAIPAGGSVADFKIDAAARKRVIDGSLAKLDSNYVFPDVAGEDGGRAARASQARRVRSRHERHELRGAAHRASPGREQGQAPSRELFTGAHSRPAPRRGARSGERRSASVVTWPRPTAGSSKPSCSRATRAISSSTSSRDPEICGPTASAAMNFLANADALIIDLRETAAAPEMVAYVTSYLFSQRTHLNDLWTRRNERDARVLDAPDVPGKQARRQKPVFVLTSRRTFSGAEEFTYNLKNLKRATIVGETTGGGAHPVSGHKVDDHFSIGVPFARAINPITKTNWEGTGVEPDVSVPASEALATAQKLIGDKRATP